MKLTRFGNYAFLFVAAFTLVFASCSKDDSPGNGGTDPGNPGSKGKRVSKVVLDYGNGEVETRTFFYNEEGVLEKAAQTFYNGHSRSANEQTFTRVNDNLVIDYVGYEGSNNERETASCKLNAEGFVTSVTNKDNETTAFSYRDGYLTGCTEPDGDTYAFTWQGGNLVKVVSADETEEITYTEDINNMNIDMLDLYEVDPFDGLPAFTSGYFGKRNKNLVKKISEGNASVGSSVEYTYKFDKEGYVTSFTLIDKEWWTGGNEAIHATATVTYE